MDAPVVNEFIVTVPTLPKGVAPYEGIPCTSWFTKCVTLTNEVGVEVARRICQNVDVGLIIDMNGEPLGDDRVAIHIAESLCKEEVPLEWMWSMHPWHISRVYLNGTSLYDHEQTHLYRAVMNGSKWRPRLESVPMRAYERRKNLIAFRRKKY